MIAVRIDASQPLRTLKAKLEAAQNKEKMLRTVAVGLLPVVKTRIHEDGKDANENPIGEYSESYMRVRTGQFANSERFKKGKNKGKTKNAGVVTKRKINILGTKLFENIESEGVKRTQYNRSADRKKVVSLTRQLENDFSVVASDTGYGLGYKNPINYKKMRWQEEQEGKPIAKLTPTEKKLAFKIAKEYISGVSA